MKKILTIVSVIIGGLSYLYLVVSTAKSNGEGLSLATFGLWSVLSWITVLALIKGRSNPSVPIVYGVGATTTTIILISKGNYGWTNLDIFVAVLTILCIVLWQTMGSRWAFLLAITAGVIAAIPFVTMTWVQPSNSPIIPNSGFLFSNSIAFVSAKSWTLEDRLYSGVNVVLGSILVLPWMIQ